jgi:beta-xylosidase
MKNFLVFSLAAMVLLACGLISTSAPQPTNTPAPLPAEIILPTTVPVEPAATPDPLLFRDDFNGALADGWQWTRENPSYWSLAKNPGWLEIFARPGHVNKANIENLLLRQAPAGNFELETRLKFKPGLDFQIAGLLIYASDADNVLFGRAYCSSSTCTGDGLYMDLSTNGNFASGNFAAQAPSTDTVFLSLRREGNAFSAYLSEDGQQWTLIGTHQSGMQVMKVGLAVGQALNTEPQPAQFDFFSIKALP